MKLLLAVIVAVLLFGTLVMWLWNMLVPPIFGWRTITFGQAIGLLVLSKILFGAGRFGGPWKGGSWRRRMWARWDQMTPEEREDFRTAMRGHCGSAESKPAHPVS